MPKAPDWTTKSNGLRSADGDTTDSNDSFCPRGGHRRGGSCTDDRDDRGRNSTERTDDGRNNDAPACSGDARSPCAATCGVRPPQSGPLTVFNPRPTLGSRMCRRDARALPTPLHRAHAVRNVLLRVGAVRRRRGSCPNGGLPPVDDDPLDDARTIRLHRCDPLRGAAFVGQALLTQRRR